MAKDTWLNVAGSWINPDKWHINDAGSWKAADAVWLNVAGTWQKIWTDDIRITSFEDDTWPGAWTVDTATNEFTTTTTNVLDGSKSLESDGSNFERIWSAPGDGLYNYPGYPCRIINHYRHQATPGSNRFHIAVGFDTDGDGDLDEGLRIGGNSDDHKFYLQQDLDDGTGWNMIGSEPYSSTGAADQWYATEMIVDDGTFLASGGAVLGHRLYEYDPSTDSYTELGRQQASFDSSLTTTGKYGVQLSVGADHVVTNWELWQDTTND